METRNQRKKDRENKINPIVLMTPLLELTDAEVRILAALYLAEDGKNFSQLPVDTGFSEPTVSKYLKELVKKKLITREVDILSLKYPPPVIYKVNVVEKDAKEITDAEFANNYKVLNIIENCYKWVHNVRFDFNELQYARHIMRVALSKLQMKDIDEIKGNNTYELAEELRQYISQTLKSRDPVLRREGDKEFIQQADLIQRKGGIDFFTAGVYPKSKSRKKGKLI